MRTLLFLTALLTLNIPLGADDARFVCQGDIIFEEIPEAAGRRVRATLEKDGKAVREAAVFDDGGRTKFILPIGIYDLGKHDIAVYDEGTGDVLRRQTFMVQRGEFAMHVSERWKTGKLSEKQAKRRAKELAEIYLAYKNPYPLPLWRDGFEFPVVKGLAILDGRGYPEVDKGGKSKLTGDITHPFGEIRKYPKTKGGKERRHLGIDVRAPIGFPVRAIAAGKVVLAAQNRKRRRGYFSLEGNLTIIDHGVGIYSLYMHQKNISVRVGDEVTRGQVIGGVGDTGNSIGSPHLHLAIKIKDKHTDPIKLMEILNDAASN